MIPTPDLPCVPCVNGATLLGALGLLLIGAGLHAMLAWRRRVVADAETLARRTALRARHGEGWRAALNGWETRA